MFDQQALTIAEQLGIGMSRRSVCPACQGGDNHEVTWVVGRESDRVWYKCFRAKCPGATGVVGGHTLPPAIQAERARALERLNPYTRPTRNLDAMDITYFVQRFEIEPNTNDILVTDDDEYVLAVRGPNRELRGRVVRQPVWKGVPKAPRQGREFYFDENEAGAQFYSVERGKFAHRMPKTVLYPQTTQPMLSWYTPLFPATTTTERHLVVVEDQLSAMKVAQEGVGAVALLGNGMNVELVRDILRQHPRVVTIALDPGAEGQAQNLAKKWGLYFERTRVVMLEADPKDIPKHDLLTELGL